MISLERVLRGVLDLSEQTAPEDREGQMTRARALRFGPFQVDPKSGEISENGSKIKLQEQPFQILVALLEHPGEVVSREELRQRLWSGDTFVDFDNSVNIAVRKLRQTLND